MLARHVVAHVRRAGRHVRIQCFAVRILTLLRLLMCLRRWSTTPSRPRSTMCGTLLAVWLSACVIGLQRSGGRCEMREDRTENALPRGNGSRIIKP